LESPSNRFDGKALRDPLQISLILTALLIAAATFLPGRRLWGINHLAFYPLAVRIAALALITLSFVPWVARSLRKALLVTAGFLSRRKKQSWLVGLIFGLIATGVFLQFRSSTLLLGDGHLIAAGFDHALAGDEAVVTSSVERIMTEENIAKGTSLLYYGVVKAAGAAFEMRAQSAISILNCILGGLLVLLLVQAAFRISGSEEFKIWLVFLLLFSGAIELFFGYVETYTPAVFFALLYMAGGFAFIRTGRKAWLGSALICLALSAFMHVQGILLAPSAILFLYRLRPGEERTRVMKFITGAVVALLVAGTALLAALTPLGGHSLSLTGADAAYGMLSPAHLADMANELLLLLPALPLFAVMGGALLLLARRHGARHPDVAEREECGEGAERKAARPPAAGEPYFALLLLVPYLLFLLVFDPRLGMARDWDLFAFGLTGLLAAALVTLKRFTALTGAAPGPDVMVPALIISAVLTASWCGINASPSRSAERYRQILTYDQTLAPYAYENLATDYYSRGETGEAISTLEKAVAHSYNARLYVLLSVYYEQAGRLDDAIDALRTVLRREPGMDTVRHDLVSLLSRAGRYDELLQVAREGTRYHPENPTYHYVYGWLLVREGRYDEGARELVEARRLNPPPQTLEQIDSILKRLEEQGKL
jgi:tetratricopeptide (TPR) repeat protein